MKTADDCQKWLRDFWAWYDAAPSDCKQQMLPDGYYWRIQNCSEEGLKWMRMYWGGKLLWDTTQTELTFELKVAGQRFWFIHQKP